MWGDTRWPDRDARHMAIGLARLHEEERSDECSWREMLLEYAVENVSSCS